MERDFMGLNSKEEAIEAVLSKSSEVPWSLSTDHESQSNRHSAEDQKTEQLTIFYRGVVNVYNDISPEKAQAIMLIVGNGAKGEGQAHVATPRTPAGDVVHVGQPINKAQLSTVSVGPSTGMSLSTSAEAPKVMNSFRRVMQSAVPQMREASLARFLEKRRERVMASAPYSNKPGSSNVPNKDDKK